MYPARNLVMRRSWAALAFLISRPYSFRTLDSLRNLAAARMSVFSGRLGLAFVLAALCLGGRTAHAQAAPVPYWTAGGPLGFGNNPTIDQSANTYGNFPGFDGSDVRGGGFSYMRYNFSY